ncbi:platelet-derived growth factor receptor alpha-like [Mytilus trossulus]|uniref:platelet-derived growth factor receptor alpha-like n=1 Tax=Mytilus trossulus TaxID=6551 RepID=UPI003007D1DB
MVTIARGIDYLGKKRILHRDLRAANVLINDNLETKISGFHLAKVLKEDEDEYKVYHGEKYPIKWTAPEAALYGKYTLKSDVWSFGIILVELTTFGNVPYRGITNMEYLERLEMGFRHEKPDNCPENIYEIMLSCWNKEPSKRPTFEYLFNYFDDYEVYAEFQKEEIDKYLRSGKNNGEQIHILYGKEDEHEYCEVEGYYTEASRLDVRSVDNTLQFTLPPQIPKLGINAKKSSTNKQHIYENVDASSNSVEDTKLKLHQVDTAGDLALYKSEQESSEEEGDHKDASGVDEQSDASDVDKNSQFALPLRIPALGINTKRSSTNKQHVYENVDVCSINLEDMKLRLQEVDTADTITTCDDIPVYLSEEEEEDNKKPCGIEVHLDASAEQEYREEEGDHKHASGVDVQSDASDVDKNSQFALPLRIPALGMNTKRLSTNKLHLYENVEVCSINLEDTKLRLQEVDTADTITTCDDIPVYLSEEEEEDRQ